jgi:salicylate 1-O-methyltransferase
MDVTAIRPAPPLGGAMEGRGYYNAHSRPQAAAASQGVELLARAAGLVEAPPAGAPIVIADYGSAEGRNSLAPVGTAVRVLRRRHRAPINVVHVDRPSNDFASLFGLLRTDPQSYLAAAEGVFAYAAGASFYDRVFPAEQVCLAWCSIALHWLGALPVGVQGHVWPSHLTGAEREPFARQADADWRAFLRHRAAELRPGGRLVAVVPVMDQDGSWGIGELAARTTAALGEMVRDGALREAELARMVVPVYNRTAAELVAPFADRTLGLVVEARSLDRTPDPLWRAYRASGDAAALAAGYAGFVRAAFGPTLAGALDPDRSPDERGAFVARLEAGVGARVAGASGPLFNAAIMSMLIAKS